MTQGIKKQLIENYQKRKHWYGKTSFKECAEVFETEVARTGVETGANILEVGFGEGLFLDWSRESGFNIAGVEINPDFYALAKERNHTVYQGDVKEVLSTSGEKYDGIFLFDVLEHLTLEEISDMFDFFQAVLKRNGRILVRVPNGASPFGRLLQHGDATHVTVLTGSKIQDIVQLSGMEVKGIFNGARTKRTGTHKNWILKWLAYRVRDFIQLAIGYLYYGENIPLDPNLTVVIGHASEKE